MFKEDDKVWTATCGLLAGVLISNFCWVMPLVIARGGDQALHCVIMAVAAVLLLVAGIFG